MAMRSWRDDTTHVLLASGDMDITIENSIVQDEDDDFALAPGLWQWDGDEWIAYIDTTLPNVDSFIEAIQTSMTTLEFNTFIARYPTWLYFLAKSTWTAVDELVIEAHDQLHIDDPLYTLILESAIEYHIPLTLPPL